MLIMKCGIDPKLSCYVGVRVKLKDKTLYRLVTISVLLHHIQDSTHRN